MMLAVITIVHGRHDHLRLQEKGLLRSRRPPDMHVVVAMGDPALQQRNGPASLHRCVVHVPLDDGPLPLARARNLGAQTAIAEGSTVLVFLDVDCIPSETLLEAYEDAAMYSDTRRDLLCGPVTYLPPAGPDGYDLATLSSLARPHPARPAPSPGSLVRTRSDYELFWSLSFALSSTTWFEIGGFDEAYVGYGGEDTDFARRAQSSGTALTWVGDAAAFHQHHPVSSPPVEHVEDIVRNAAVFHDRWGQWPMEGWLAAFEERGLVSRGPDGQYRVAPDHDLASGG